MNVTKKYKAVIEISIMQIIILFLMLLVYVVNDEIIRQGIYILIILCGVSLYYWLYVIYRDIKRNILLENENMLAKQQEKMQEEHILAMKENMEYYSKIRDEIIEKINMYDDLKIDTEEDAREFTIKLLKEYEKINKIDYCSNKVIDAILYNKLLLAKSNNIEINVQVLVPEYINIKPIDLMSVYANLLDNAIEACLKLPQSQRFIKVDSQVKANYLIVKVVNSKLKEIVVDIKSGKSTKLEEGHGLGLQIIKNACESNEGSLIIEDHGDNVMIFASLKI